MNEVIISCFGKSVEPEMQKHTINEGQTSCVEASSSSLQLCQNDGKEVSSEVSGE